ncbi:hypothetical protein OEZ85_000414 [Tetradesmus obliquus]|uniref:Enoyl reductase (ER) domain-containing protein n=1 Tax=Tetradesmus obliquus TaxID=3088 RepID=A0ABY8UTX1_TETOB|nr:hypothetical protein OEZ85_000414 [Tetradesmus obliquus]
MALQVISVLWKAHVEDRPVAADDFEVATNSIDPQAMGEGDILVELLYLSVDPYMRGMMRDSKGYYRQPFTPGQPLSSRGIARVVRAGPGVGSGFEEGDVLSGMLPWSSHAILNRRAQAALQLVDSRLLGKLPLPCFLGALGAPGMTAWAGLKKIAEPIKQGEVAFVSGAAGAVGLVAGQLLKTKYGCNVIGSAGSNEKVALLQQLGFDAAFNYKTTDTAEALTQVAPDGIDIYFDNVGGPTLDAALAAARPHARFLACGAISQYDTPEDSRYGVKNLMNVITKRIKLRGFIVGDYAAELGGEFHEDMSQLLLAGKVKALQHVTQGLENAGAAFVGMMGGGNVGKALVQVVETDPFPVQQ